MTLAARFFARLRATPRSPRDRRRGVALLLVITWIALMTGSTNCFWILMSMRDRLTDERAR